MHALPDTPCELAGELMPLHQARVSVLDRGFIFGDGIYEAIPAYGGRLFRFEHHMARLERGLAAIRIAPPRTRDMWLAAIRRLVNAVHAHTGHDDLLVYMQVTRGVAPRDHVMPADAVPTVFMMANPLPRLPAAAREQGVACITARDFRWERGDIKSISLLGNVLARQLSADVGAVETIMFRDGFLTEASASNVWIVQHGSLLGPPEGGHLLDGIRVELLRELCEREHIPFARRAIREQEVHEADEVLLSSATKEVLPVTTIDGAPVGTGTARGRPGPVYTQLYAAYQRAKERQSI